MIQNQTFNKIFHLIQFTNQALSPSQALYSELLLDSIFFFLFNILAFLYLAGFSI